MTITNNQKSPFHVRLFANVGTAEPWIAALIGVVDLLHGISYGRPGEGSDIKQISSYVMQILEELISADAALKRLRVVSSQSNATMIDLGDAFNDLYDHLHCAAEDRLKPFVKSIGFDPDFLYIHDTALDCKLKELARRDPPLPNPDIIDTLASGVRGFRPYLNALKIVRDTNQHRGDRTGPDAIGGSNKKQRSTSLSIEQLYNLNDANMMFDYCWQYIEFVAAGLIGAQMEWPFVLVEVSEEERSSSRPSRYQIGFSEDFACMILPSDDVSNQSSPDCRTE